MKQKIIACLFFTFILFLGFKIIPNINANFDEITEENIILNNAYEYAEIFNMKEVTNDLDSKQITPISSNIEKDHGVATYYVLTPLILLRDKYPHLLSQIWHIYTFMIFFISCIFFFKLMNKMYSSSILSYFMTGLYALSPRIFIDGMHNNKDIVFMSLLIYASYYLYKILENNKRKDMIIFSIIAAFICNIKILGIFFSFILGITYVIYLIINKRINKSNIFNIIMVIILILGIYILITPAIWGSGKFDIINFIKYNLDNSVNFRANIKVLFDGIKYSSVDGNPLPWYYLPKLMLITLPITVSIIFIVSFVYYVYSVIKRVMHKNKLEKYDFIVCSSILLFIVPFLICVCKKPNIYNGWRHFYFLYAPLLLISSFLIYKIAQTKKVKYFLYVIICITLIFNIYNLTKYGVANTAYYNILTSNKDLSKKYELDYYNVTSLDAVMNFINLKEPKRNSDNKIYLYGSDFNKRILSDLYFSSSTYFKDNVAVASDENIKDLLKKNCIVYQVSNPMYTYSDLSKKELVYSYKFKYSNLINFYKMEKEVKGNE